MDEKKYGDCKALTNYMRYMLKTVGIKSYPALINGGASKVSADPAFPADPFNHVILCIPQGKDSAWLECTSNISETGFRVILPKTKMHCCSLNKVAYWYQPQK